jgi:hypothetical protein
MTPCQNHINSGPFSMIFFLENRRSHRTLAATARHQFTATHCNWSREEDKNIAAKLPDVILEPEDRRIDPPPSPVPEGATPPSWAATATSQAVCYPRWEPSQPPLRFELNPIENRALRAKIAELARAPRRTATHHACHRRRRLEPLWAIHFRMGAQD